MTTKFAALAVFFLCFMPATKIEHTEALFTLAKKPKQESSTLVADLNRNSSVPKFSKTDQKHSIHLIKLSSHLEQKAKPEKTAYQPPKKTYSSADRELLSRLVHAEAKGESYKGKVAVASVVLNRTEKKGFPDTIRGVIYQRNAFEPVANGSINQKPDKDSIAAANEALNHPGRETNALFFYNPKIASDHWIRSRKIIERIGRHVFAM
ncbi:cell wall hydrolase [Bacillus siamensis]|uniref:cell wall hydrolase n=1 Tax=Bacillus siamensis TaxID=659243 RepID=UPI002230FB76|nr:cell wall hydrolase [Bacillus siamensis]UZD75490.1 cell wall hydrolase [Bacillus siamensis]